MEENEETKEEEGVDSTEQTETKSKPTHTKQTSSLDFAMTSLDEYPIESESYDENELKQLAARLAPRVSALLSDEALANLLGNVDVMLEGSGMDDDDSPMSKKKVLSPRSKKKALKKTSPSRSTLRRLSSTHRILADLEEETGGAVRSPTSKADDGIEEEEDDAESDEDYEEGGEGGMMDSSNLLSDYDDDEDDAMDAEWAMLAAAEENLREELEMAGGLELLLGGPDMSKPGTPNTAGAIVNGGDDSTLEGVDEDGGDSEHGGWSSPRDQYHNIGRRHSSTDLPGWMGGASREGLGDKSPLYATAEGENDGADGEVGGRRSSFMMIGLSGDLVPMGTGVEEEEDVPGSEVKTSMENDQNDPSKLPPESSKVPSTPAPVRLKQTVIVPYTLADHASFLSVRRDPEDLGAFATCPLVGKADAMALLAVDHSAFHPENFDLKGRGEGIGSPGEGSMAPMVPDVNLGLEPSQENTTQPKDTDKQSAEDLTSSQTQNSNDPKTEHLQREILLREIMNCTREYIVPVPSRALRKLYAGLVPPATSPKSRRRRRKSESPRKRKKRGRRNRGSGRVKNSPASENAGEGKEDDDDEAEEREILPVRTVTIRVRPDVLCGAIMDALSASVEALGGEMTKRQGGHLKAILPPFRLGTRDTALASEGQGQSTDDVAEVSSGIASMLSFGGNGSKGSGSGNSDASHSNKIGGKSRILPSCMVDAQLCTRKLGKEFERVLLVRTYRSDDDVSSLDHNGVNASSYTFVDCDDGRTGVQPSEWGGQIVREAAALVQRMDSKGADFHFVEHSASDSESTSPALPVTPVSLPSTGQPIPTPTSLPAHHDVVMNSRTPNSSVSSKIGNILTSPIRILSGSSSRQTPIDIDGDGCVSPTRNPPTPLTAGSDRSRTVLLNSNASVAAESVAEATSRHLLGRYRPAPSVKDVPEGDGRVTLPGLSKGDWGFVQAGWRFLREVLNELDNRDLAYSTLFACPFGAFPALPTLDVQYCSQIRLVCREHMIVALLKTASELEQYARESEYSCANLIQLLQTTFDNYRLAAPALPQPVPLTAYPLDFQPPEATCPPWGQRVMEALNIVAAKSSSDNQNYPPSPTQIDPSEIDSFYGKKIIGFQKSRDAVGKVVAAFQKQDDEEQGARLGRKNVQVMDRLAKMQAHKRTSIISIRDSYGCNLLATKAADDFHNKAQNLLPDPTSTNNVSTSSPISFFPASDQVPLLQCGILVGGATGTCYITAHQILFVTHSLLSILGGNRFHLYSIPSIELVVMSASTSLLNPLPAGISIREGKGSQDEGDELFSFIPSLGAKRFKNLVDVIRTVGSEDPETLKFSPKGGLLYMFNEQNSVKRAALEGGDNEEGKEEGGNEREQEEEEIPENTSEDVSLVAA